MLVTGKLIICFLTYFLSAIAMTYNPVTRMFITLRRADTGSRGQAAG